MDSGNCRVEEFNSSGSYLSQFGVCGSQSGKLNAPIGIAFDSSGNIWVVDSGNTRMEKFSGSGAYITKFGSWGSGNGQFNAASGLAIDGGGNLWVVDTGNYRVQEDFGIGIVSRAEVALKHYEPLRNCPGVEVRVHGTTLYNSIYRFDDVMLVNTHVWGLSAFAAPVLHLRRLATDGMFDMYAQSFDAVWSTATPAYPQDK